MAKANEILEERAAAATALAAAELKAGSEGSRCEREKNSEGEHAKGPDGRDIPRPTCDTGLCCGAAQK